MRVGESLQEKGHRLHSVGCDCLLDEAARQMQEHHVGALLCVDGSGGIIGILSERDITRALAEKGGDAATMPVSRYMTRDVIACQSDDSVEHLLAIMVETGCRHLPVVEDGETIGLVSIADLVKAEHHF